VRRDIPLTEYFSFRLPSASEPGEARPLDVARYCARMVEEHGSRIFEGKVGTMALDQEVEMVREIRAAIGERRLQLDANGGWTVPTAREAFRRLDPFVIHYYEEPVETYEEMAELRSAILPFFPLRRCSLSPRHIKRFPVMLTRRRSLPF
jgi:glucarate dehydratase